MDKSYSPSHKFPFALTEVDFCRAFGVASPQVFPDSTTNLISTLDFCYSVPSECEQSALCFDINGRIDYGFSRVGEHRVGIWADTWSEVKERFEASNFSIDELIPKFVGATDYLRLGSKYVQPKDAHFEISFFYVLRDWLFKTYLSSYAKVVELGSGSGFNVIELSRCFPEIQVVGADWSQSAVDILKLYACKTNAKVDGYRFDFFHPSDLLEISQDTAIMTFCAFEQIGEKFDSILQFILDRRPSRVVQVEPVIEFYNPSDPFDLIAMRYHKSRGYLEGYYSALLRLEADGKIRILHAKRTGFGSLFNECYSVLVWELI